MYFHKLAVSFCLSATVMVGFVPSMPGVQAQNIALNADAIQSSTHSHGLYANSASLAVDGNINGGTHYSISMTENWDYTSFWEVDLNGSYNISKIFVFNRGALDAPDRINGFQLKVLDADNNAQYNYTDDDASGRNLFEIDLLQGDVGSKVRIELPKLRNDSYLQLAEVMVFGEQENVAMKGTATQSSTYESGEGYGGNNVASRAIDGGSVALDLSILDKMNSMTHTDLADLGTDVWWNLELDQDYIISQVIIFNRSHGYISSIARIKGFVLQVLDKDGNEVFTHTDPGTYADADTPLSFVIDVDPSNNVGKQVRIELPTGEQKFLHLQEVMVFGVPVVPPVVVPDGQVGGDPHIQPFEAPAFSFHGQYDGVMMASKEFADGLGIDVHIRTTRVDNPRMSYSYISGTAVKIGTDILEVQDDGSIIVNGEDEFLLEDAEAETAGTTFAGYPITKTMKGTKRNIFVYDLALDVDGGDKSIEIRVNLKTGMIFVDVAGSFPKDTVGLLGSPHHDALLARDGKTDLTGDWNTFGEEWQVQSDEPKLFQDKNRVPQHPAGCIYESQQVKSNLRHRHRRRLMVDSAGSNEDATAVEAAEKACVRATGEKKQFCIDDVMATGDLELAEDSFYN